MYNSKEAGRNQLHLFNSEMNRRIAEMMDMKNRLARGLEHDQFFLLFQPQIDLRSHRLAGLEAFIRWRDPEKGPVSPLTFLRVAEETGLIVPLGTWILKTACRQARTWQDAGLPPVRITVNLSARQFRAPGFVESVTEILGQNRLPPHLLGLEIKEATSARELDFVLRSLRRLKALGLHIALDDFGTGTSSLGFLRSFPFDAVKIDVSLLHETSTSEAGRLLVQSIIAAGHGLNLEVAAEGVESREQLDFVTRSGCDLAQGYLLAKPLPADQIHPLLTKQSWT